MSIPRPLVPSDIEKTREQLIRQRSRDFMSLARHLMLHGNQAHIADVESLSDRMRTLTRAAVMGGTLASLDALSTLGVTAGAWLETLRTASAFDAMLPSMRPALIHQPFAISSVALIAGEIDEGQGKPVSALTLNTIDALAPRKTAAIIVTTKELLRFSGAGDLIDTELRNAVAAGTDALFLAYIISQTTPIASAGNTVANVLTDIGALLDAVPLGATSRPFFVFSPAAAKKLALKQTNAVFAFPGVSPLGGNIAGIPVIVSDQLPAGAALLADASAIAAAGGDVQLLASEHANIQMLDAVTNSIIAGSPAAPVPTNTTSLWQTNSAAIRAERTFAFRLLRSTAAASLSGVSY